MFKRIGTRALKCEHGSLIGIDLCKECDPSMSGPKFISGAKMLPWVKRPYRPMVSPMQHLGMSVQSSLEDTQIPVHHKLHLRPVWAGTMEEMSEGRMVFGLSTGNPRDEYEDPEFQLIVTMKIKHTAPWWLRVWRWVTRYRLKPWEQQVGHHHRSDGKGGSIKVLNPDRPYIPHIGTECPKCGGKDYNDHSSFERGMGGEVNVLTCQHCHQTWYFEGAVESVG